jgi:integrase/recombinase XerD
MALQTTKNTMSVAHAEKTKNASRHVQKKGSRVTEERAKAQRAKLDTQAELRHVQEEQDAASQNTQTKKTGRQDREAKRRVIETLIEAYIQDHIGGNHSHKTVEWHRTALGLMQLFFQGKLDMTQIDDVEADDISAWFAHMRTTPGAHGNVRSERTIQTYARSARAFFHWLIRRGTLEHNPFDRVVFPKVGRPLIQTISDEEFDSSCWPVPHPTRPGLLLSEPRYAIVRFSGSSTIRASASLNSSICVWAILTASTASSQ